MSGVQKRASAVCTVKFVQGLGTFRSLIRTTQGVGEITQRYAQGDMGTCVPDFRTRNLTVWAEVWGERGQVGGNDMTVTWSVGNQTLTFNPTTGACQSVGWTNVVRLTTPGDTTSVTFINNLAAVLGGISSYLRADIYFDADGNGTYDQTWARADISLREVTQNDREVMIVGSVATAEGGRVGSLNVTDSVATNPGGTVWLKALYYEGATEKAIPAGHSLVWGVRGDDNAWHATEANDDGEVAVTAADVNSTRAYKVSLYDGPNGTGTLVHSDYERVRDLTDELQIAPNPNRDETVYAPGAAGYEEGVTDRVTYHPKLMSVSQDGSLNVVAGHTNPFTFGVIGTDGEDVGAPVTASSATGFTVGLEIMGQVGGDAVVVITTEV